MRGILGGIWGNGWAQSSDLRAGAKLSISLPNLPLVLVYRAGWGNVAGLRVLCCFPGVTLISPDSRLPRDGHRDVAAPSVLPWQLQSDLGLAEEGARSSLFTCEIGQQKSARPG